MNKKVRGGLVGLTAFATTLALLSAGLGAWSIISGESDADAWGTVGLFALAAAVLGGLSTLFQYGWKPVSQEPHESTHSASRVMDGGAIETRRRALMTDALRQQLINDFDKQLAGSELDAGDEILSSYEQAPVSWESLWREANERRGGLPPRNERPYWIPAGPNGNWVPSTMLAFWGTDSRTRVAMDPDTDPALLRMMASDPNPRVRTAVAANR